jgi:hypothetical protein
MRLKHPHAAESGVGKHTARESERAQACATGRVKTGQVTQREKGLGNRMLSRAFGRSESPGLRSSVVSVLNSLTTIMEAQPPFLVI